MKPPSWRAALVALLAVVMSAACGSVAGTGTPSRTVAETEMQVLASSALPGMPSQTTVLAVTELGNDASIPGLASKVKGWGYLDGRERVFQGQSRHLTLVVSRSLVFADADGAGAFVVFVGANAQAYFGGGLGKEPMVAQGRSGWLFTPAACACHMANPAVAGVVAAGSRVIWLEINGPDATPALLVSLLDPSLSAPTTLP